MPEINGRCTEKVTVVVPFGHSRDLEAAGVAVKRCGVIDTVDVTVSFSQKLGRKVFLYTAYPDGEEPSWKGVQLRFPLMNGKKPLSVYRDGQPPYEVIYVNPLEWVRNRLLYRRNTDIDLDPLLVDYISRQRAIAREEKKRQRVRR